MSKVTGKVAQIIGPVVENDIEDLNSINASLTIYQSEEVIIT